MDEQTKRKMIRKYFAQAFPKWALVLIGIGLLMLLSGETGPVLFGLILAGGGGFAIYNATLGRPTDQQIDEWLQEDLATLGKTALRKTGTDEADLVGEPVSVTGPKLWDVGGAEVLYKRGKDNALRFTPIAVSIMNFTQHQLVAYSCVYDFTTGKSLNESTDEYFYRDVVSVATKTESRTVTFKNLTLQMNSAETFTLTTSGGTSISVFLRDPKLIEQMGGGDIPTGPAEKAIQTVRKMLREKKAQVGV